MSSKTSRMRVRALATFAILGLAGTALAGCAGSSEGSDSTLTVSINGGAAMKSLVPEFEAANPGVKVEIKDTADADGQIVATQLTGGNAPDVIQIQTGSGGQVSAVKGGDAGYFANLSDEAWAADVPEGASQKLVNSAGELMGVPMTFSSIGGVYNTAALESIGATAPTTWPEVLQLCADAKAAGKVAYGLGLSDTWTTQLIPYALVATLVYAQDPDFVEQQNDGTATFSDSGWKTAFDQYVEMEDAGCFNDSPAGTPYATVQQAVADGTTLGTVTVAAETAAIGKLGGSDLELEYAAFPATDDASETYLSANVGPSFAVNAKAKNPELAKKFVAWLASPETQVAYADAYGDTAAMPGDLTQDSQVATLVSSYVADEKISGWPDNLWPDPAVQQAMFTGVQGIFSGQATVESALQTMDDTFQAALN